MGAVGQRSIRRGVALGLGTALALAGTVGGPADSVRAAEALAPRFASLGGDALEVLPQADYALSPQLAAMLGTATLPGTVRSPAAAGRGQATPPVGTTLLWPALDVTGQGALFQLYLKPYTLRASGDHIEVWVASGVDLVSAGTAFPDGDCREEAVKHSTRVTDAQAQALVREFDTRMYPKEVAAFSTPPARGGTKALPGVTAAGLNFAGNPGNTVALVDNVRDPNFYDFPTNRAYVAGFHAPVFDQMTDRNVMTIDAYDWAHRTGENPRNEPDKDLCKSRTARPRSYESTFAHEWQHLLESHRDPGEALWINEGLADFATSLVGYGDPKRTIAQKRAEPHLFCFQGWGTVEGPANANPAPCGGPQNSLTVWKDEGTGLEVLADYGSAWSFMLFLYDRYGAGFIRDLHADGTAHGLYAIQEQLERYGGGVAVSTVMHDFQLANLLDREIDNGAKVFGIDADRVSSASLHAALNLNNEATFNALGVAPNAADYVLLRGPGRRPLHGRDLDSFSFLGESTLTDSEDEVGNWHVSLVGIDAARHRVLVRSWDEAYSLTPYAKTLAAFATYPRVVAVIAHDELQDLTAEESAGYDLTVNGRGQGG